MKLVLVIVGVIFVLGALVAGCIAVVNDEDSLGRTFNEQAVSFMVPASAARFVASHERDRCYDDCGDDWGGGSDGNSGGDYEGGRSGDNDQRGDHNCRNFCFYGVPIPGGGDQPQGLFPPTPDGIRQFVLSTIQAGIEMGRLFADTTITFVSNLLVGIA